MNKSFRVKFKSFTDAEIIRLIKTALPFLLAFFVPFVLTIILFKQNGYYPFDENGHSLAMIDMQGQYLPFFRYYKQILNGDADIIYTLGKVLGGDMISIFLYYLASPFNLMIAFFSVSELPAALLWIVVLKVGCSGLTGYIALNNINKNGYANLIFSISYALIAYNFVYYSNIMWLDGVIALPLVTLGIKHIIDKKMPLLYIFALAYVLMTSWYIGIMVCMFSAFFFLTEYFGRANGRSGEHKTILTFTIASLVAGIASFAFWGSAIINIMGTKGSSSFSNLSITIKHFYEAIRIERGFVFGGYAGMSDITGQAIAIYVGAIPMILTLLFFTNKGVDIKRRLIVGGLFAVYLLAFFNQGLDHLFHGGPAPNWFPGRYTFIFGFLLVFYGAESFKKIEKLPWYSFFVPLVIYGLFLLKLKGDNYSFNLNGVIFFFVGIILLLAIYLLKANIFKSKNPRKKDQTFLIKVTTSTITLLLLVASVSNVYANANIVLASFNTTLNHESMEVYRQDEKLADAVSFVKTSDPGLYRLEKSFIRDGTYNNANNDAMYYGYNGLSHYSSSEKQTTMNYLKKIGYHYNGFNLNYANGSTLAMNAYLGVKYLIDKGQNVNFDFVKTLTNLNYDQNGISIYENQFALPFLFAMETTNYNYVGEGAYLPDNTIHWFDMFEYQNNIFKALTHSVVDGDGVQKDIFKKATYTTTLSGVEVLDSEYEYKAEKNSAVSYKVDFDHDTNYYYYIHTKNANDLRLSENGRNKTYFSYHGYQINGMTKGPLNGRLSVLIDEPKDNVYLKEAIYYEDLVVLQEYIEAIKANATVDISQKKTSAYEAEVTTSSDNQTMLMSLPYDQNIKVTVNGRYVKTSTRQNIFTSFVIPTQGVNKISIKYVQASFNLGIPLGVITLGASIGVVLFLKSPRKKKDITTPL